MRLILVAFALCAVWYYVAGTDVRSGTQLLQQVENTAVGLWSALPRPGKQAEQDLLSERRRSTNLETELFRLRDKLTRADAEAVTRETSLGDAVAASKTHEEAEKSAMARVVVLDAQLAAARQGSALRSETLQKQMSESEARAAELNRNNQLLQERLESAAVRIAAADTARASLQGNLRAAVEGAQRQQEQSRSLASDLDRLRETSSSRIEDLQGQLEGAKARVASHVEAPRSENWSGVAVRVASGGAEPIVPQPLTKLGRDTLIEGARTRVVVRFSSNSPSAKARALKLCATLQTQGILIEQIAGSPSTLQADSLAYFYKNDESRAASIVTQFPEFRSTMRQRPLEDKIPRPGLIEIEVAT